MCYNTKQTSRVTELEAKFKVRLKDKSRPISAERFNGFQFPHTPVILNFKSDEISLCQWGLIPKWAKDESIQKFTLNAKIETLDEKPSFKNNIDNRCLVLVNGFYEWQWLDAKGKRKQQYEITSKNGEPFAMAGIWSQWVNPISKEVLITHSIVTTEASTFMAEIHNSKKRMPIMLSDEASKNWLDGESHSDFKSTTIELKANPLIDQYTLF